MRVDTLAKISSVVGFLGVSTAIVAAYLDPATGYEMSIYTATPLAFWALCLLSLLISVLVVFSGSRRSVRSLGAFLGGVTMTAIVSLPIVRGYHYLGEHDPLSHLGAAKIIDAGTMEPTELFYPVDHTLGVVLHDVTGLALNHAMLILVVVFVVCFVVFVPLVVRELTGGGWATYIGLFSGFLLLPINHVGSHLYIFPTSQAIMYAPAFLFAFFLLYRQRTARRSVMFLLIALTFVMLHPQQAANLLLFFGVIAGLQIGYDVLQGDRLTARSEWVLPEVSVYAVAFLLWASRFERFWNGVEAVFLIPFVGRPVGGKAATRSISLTQVGGSLPELFLKLFSVQFAYVVLTGLLMLVVLRRSQGFRSLIGRDTAASDGGTDQMLSLYIYVGLTVVAMIFVVYFVGGISDQIFRHLGMLMVFGTVLGAIAIGRATRFVRRRWSGPTARRSLALLFVGFIVISLPVVFASPYIYYYSHHVTEQQMHGYGTTFEHRSESILFDDIRSDTYRYGHGTQGMDRPPEAYYGEGWRDATHGIPDHFANRSLRSHYDEPIYVPVPEADRVRDPVLWKGFRFSHEDFDYLDSEPGINRVQTNGGYDLYVVEPMGNRSSEPA